MNFEVPKLLILKQKIQSSQTFLPSIIFSRLNLFYDFELNTETSKYWAVLALALIEFGTVARMKNPIWKDA